MLPPGRAGRRRTCRMGAARPMGDRHVRDGGVVPRLAEQGLPPNSSTGSSDEANVQRASRKAEHLTTPPLTGPTHVGTGIPLLNHARFSAGAGGSEWSLLAPWQPASGGQKGIGFQPLSTRSTPSSQPGSWKEDARQQRTPFPTTAPQTVSRYRATLQGAKNTSTLLH